MLTQQEQIKLITQVIEDSAKSSRESAGFSGSWGDNGAAMMEAYLVYWLDGVNFATTGITKQYGHILDKYERENDPDYQQYLALKKKFESC